MSNKNILQAVTVGLTLAVTISTVGLGLALYAVKRDGVVVKLPMVGAVDVKFDGSSTSGVVLPSSASSVLAVLPAIVLMSAVAGAFAAGMFLSRPAVSAPGLPGL